MENNQKKVLLQMAYYSLAGLAIVFSLFFIYRTIYSGMPLYIRIIYYVWSGTLVLTMVYDIICTLKKEMKFISGVILFVLAILSVIMAVDVFFMQGVNFRTIRTLEITYFIDMTLSFVPMTLSVFAFLFGEKLIEFEK